MNGASLQSVDETSATGSDMSSCTGDEREAFMRSYGGEGMQINQGHPRLEDFLGSKNQTGKVLENCSSIGPCAVHSVNQAASPLSSLKESVLSVYKDNRNTNESLVMNSGVLKRALAAGSKESITNEGMHEQYQYGGAAFASPTLLTLTQPITANLAMDSTDQLSLSYKAGDRGGDELQSIFQYSANASCENTLDQRCPNLSLEADFNLSRALLYNTNWRSNTMAAYTQDMGNPRGNYLHSYNREGDGMAMGDLNSDNERAFASNGIPRVNTDNGCLLGGSLNNPNFSKLQGSPISSNGIEVHSLSLSRFPYHQQSALSLSRDTTSCALKNNTTMSPQCEDQYRMDIHQAEALKLSMRNCRSLVDAAVAKRADQPWQHDKQNHHVPQSQRFVACAADSDSRESTINIKTANDQDDPCKSRTAGGAAAGFMESSILNIDDPLQLQMVHSSAEQKMVHNNNSAAASIDANNAESTSRKSIETFGQRTSVYRGVTKHRWTGRFEAHLWDNSCRREGQTRKGRQVYLGGYDMEEKAARAYDLAALKYWGPTTTINFPLENYEKELEEMKSMTKQEFVASLRRKSSGFSRGASIYRGVTRHHQHGRWQARIGRVAGNKDLYLGTFSTQEEAAEAYDIAAIKFRGMNAVTNFDMNKYDIEKICSNNLLPIQAMRRVKDNMGTADLMQVDDAKGSNVIGFHRENSHLAYGNGSFDIAARAGTLQEWQFINQLSQSNPLYHDNSLMMWSKLDQERARYALHTGLLFHQSNNLKFIEGAYSALMQGATNFPYVESSFQSMQGQSAPDLERPSSMLATQLPSSRYNFGGPLFMSHMAEDPSNVCDQVQAPECVSLQL